MQPRRLVYGVASTLLVTFGTPAQALTEFCVNTVNEFDSAWVAADSDDVVIKLVTGTYDFNASCLDGDGYCEVTDNDITIRGGYNSNCSARSENPASTVITAPNNILALGTLDEPIFANLTVERLTFRDVRAVSVRLEDVFSGDYNLHIERVWFDQADEGVSIGLIDHVDIHNTLITRSGSTGGVYAMRLFNIDHLEISNSSFASNMKPGLGVRDSSGTVSRSIFWGNTGPDLSVEEEPDGSSGNDEIEMRLINNTYGTIEVIGTWLTPPSATLTGNPLFVNAAAQDFRLQTTSPAINSGNTNASLLDDSDFDGGPRWYGDKPDRGVFESNIGTTATTLIVTSSGDSGAGTLRQAIIDANAGPNINRIEFDIGSSCGPRVITLQSSLPEITNPVVIDGFTQPGASRNTLGTLDNSERCIILNGQGGIAYGLVAATDPDVVVTIDGLAFSDFPVIAVYLSGGDGHRLIGSQFGSNVGGINLVASPVAVQLGSLFTSALAEGVEIGGDTVGERNLFYGATDSAIRVGSGARNAQISGNWVGAGGLGNRDGIVVQGFLTTIVRNVISRNTRHGIRVTGTDARGTQISDNRIGLPPVCIIGCGGNGNAGDGVRIENDAESNTVSDNMIGFNSGDGVVITSARLNTLLRNELTDNDEQAIDLGDDGTSTTTNNSAANLPPGNGNDAQNRPILASAAGTPDIGTVSGTLTSRNGWYRIDVYAGTNCPGTVFPVVTQQGEPQYYLRSGFVEISNGTANFDGTANFQNLFIFKPGDFNFFNTPRKIMATATRLSGSTPATFQNRGTSEMSSCVNYDLRFFADGFETP